MGLHWKRYFWHLLLVGLMTIMGTTQICRQGQDNCVKCFDGNLCSECSSGYQLIQDRVCLRCSLLNCKICLGIECLVCQDGYFLKDKKCYSCNSCKQCLPTNASHCLSCFQGKSLTETNTCIDCSISRCFQCVVVAGAHTCPPCPTAMNGWSHNFTMCLRCNYSNDVFTCPNSPALRETCLPRYYPCPNHLYHCISCSAYCQVCLDLSSCTRCISRYGRNSTGYCQNCFDPYCNNCSLNYVICTKCINGYGLNISNQCVKCNINYCIDCTYDTKCQKCDWGYRPSDLGNCQKCEQNRCGHCQANSSFCFACGYSNYYIFPVDGLCGVCYDNDCVSCSSYFICDDCIYGMGLKYLSVFKLGFFRICELCNETILNCEQCKTTNINQCLRCQEYYFVETAYNPDRCSPCSPNCTSCANSSFCLSCQDNFTTQQTSSNSNQCFPCIKDSNSNICKMCIYNCTECFFVNGIMGCAGNCSEGYYFEVDSCFEICGDEKNDNFECDRFNGIPYSGCLDNCKSDEGFFCFTEFKQSFCSYTDKITMKFKGISMSEKWNYFTIKIEIFPFLYVFKTLSASEIKELFQIQNENIEIKQFSVDPNTGLLLINFQLKGHLSPLEIKFSFLPNNQTKQQFRYSISSQLLIDLTDSGVFFYSNDKLKTFQILKYFSWVTLGLGWLSFVIGIYLRKLAGLESMFVLSLGWLSILWSNSRFLNIFNLFYPFKFSSGYNIQIIEQNVAISTQSPYTSQFGLSYQHLINNSSIMMILLLVLLIVCCAFSLHLYIFGKNKQFMEEEQLLKFDNFVIYRNLFLQVWMNFAFVFIIPLVSNISMFFKYQKVIEDILGIVLVVVSMVIYLILLAWFFFDPHQFDYFRYSFKMGFSYQYYFYYFFTLVSTVALLIFLSSVAYIIWIPLFILLVYTIGTRPYILIRENIRSSFNLLVMCCIIGFQFYTERIKENNIKTYLFVVIIIGLIFVVVVVGLISLLYEFVMIIKKNNMKKLEDQQNIMTLKILHDISSLNVTDKIQKIQNDLQYRQFLPSTKSFLQMSRSFKQERDKIQSGLFKQKIKIDLEKFKKYQDTESGSNKKTDLTDFDKLIWHDNNMYECENDKQEEKYRIKDEPYFVNGLGKNVLVNENKFINFKNAQIKAQNIMKQEYLFLEEYEQIQ